MTALKIWLEFAIEIFNEFHDTDENALDLSDHLLISVTTAIS